MIFTLSPVTNCHTFPDPLPLERDMDGPYLETITVIVVIYFVNVHFFHAIC